MNKKLLSTILVLTMVLNITLPHINVYADEINNTSQSEIENQLKKDLSEEKANDIIHSSSENREYYASTGDQHTNVDSDDLDMQNDFLANKENIMKILKNEIENGDFETMGIVRNGKKTL